MSATKIPPALTGRQRVRAAGSTINGYLYQFENSIAELLAVGPQGGVRVEGIEDIDLWSANERTAVQVKYFERQHYSGLKALRDPILSMLRSFAEGHRLNYILHLHYGEGEGPPKSISVEQLKDCLTLKTKKRETVRYYTEFSPAVLEDFVQVFSLRSGASLEGQRKEVISGLARALHCDEEDARILHRMRAVQFIQEAAALPHEVDRYIKYEDFISFLDVRELLYGRWHRESVDFEQFVSRTVRHLKSRGFNRSIYERGVLIQPRLEDVEVTIDLAAELANDITGKKRTNSAKPWTLILRADVETVDAVKRGLLTKGIPFNDGREDLGFFVYLFCEPPIYNVRNASSMVEKASYAVRIISEASLEILAQNEKKLARLIIHSTNRTWHDSVTKDGPDVISGVSIGELTWLLDKVTS